MRKKLNKILISNDDGYESIGLEVLLKIAEQLADNIFVVSPKKNQSAKSKSITIKEHIQFKEISKNFWIVDGTPTDCMIFALNYLFKKTKPDLILSGINAGSNIGDEVSYSGTVAAAWEGAVRKIDSIALSQYGGDDKINSYECSKAKAFDIINYLLKIKSKTPKFYNVNFPNTLSSNVDKIRSSFTSLASQKIADEIFFNDDFSSFTIGRMVNDHKSLNNTDLECLQNNKISITPLSLNLSNNEFINKVNYDI